MNISKTWFKISQKSLIVVVWFNISTFLLLFNFKSLISFSSVDELLFITIDQADTSVHFLRYVLWGRYISFLYNVSPYIPLIFHLFLFSIGLSLFCRKYEIGNLQLTLLLCLPSLLLFSQTYLRDFFLLILNLFLFLNLGSASFGVKFIVRPLLVAAIFLLRPILGVVICSSFLFSFFINRLRFALGYLLVGQTVILIALLNFPELNAEFLSIYKGISTENYFSLFHYDLDSINEQQLVFGTFLNWLLFYCGVNLGMKNVLLLIPFAIEALIYCFFIVRYFLLINPLYKVDKLYRFSVWCLIFSMVIGFLESDWASVYRHKLFFLAPLLYLSTSKSLRHDFS